ncbi:A-kinase anchor protein 1, mitochondrial-like isoform X1 [Ornithodoros turicata]|uniref:A-kinase anchor protein 1, mitochondrial-like isoform X1 n=1 Tax=Ornithodoros turicata TaxID=34597 RepID=UPI003138AC94
MAGLGPRAAVACTVPAAALVLLISLFLFRRRLRHNQQHPPQLASVDEPLLEPEASTDTQSQRPDQDTPLSVCDSDIMALKASTDFVEDEAPSPELLRNEDDDVPSREGSVDSALCESLVSSSAAESPKFVDKQNEQREEEDRVAKDMSTLCLDADEEDDGVETDARMPAKTESCAEDSKQEVIQEEEEEVVAIVSPVGDSDSGTCVDSSAQEKAVSAVTCDGDNVASSEGRAADDSTGDASLSLQTAFSDAHSEGSSDSGKGSSDIHVGSDSTPTIPEDLPTVYEFELPQDLCGRLIGRGGRNVAAIKDQSNANVFVRRHPFNPKLKLCAVEGTQGEVKMALEMIRKKFPLNTYPSVTLAQINLLPYMEVPLPETLQLNLPEGVTCDVVLTSMVTAGHFFLQQPTHPTYPSLARLDQCMLACYSQVNTPPLPQPAEAGIICAAQVMGGWFRALVVGVSEDGEECDVKFVDYGGYLHLSTSYLRQIRSDFMTLPFQASECYLANVQPVEGNTWSVEACAMFEDLAQGQILQSLIVGYAENGIPYVHLYRIQGVSNVFINRELVNRRAARWVELTH